MPSSVRTFHVAALVLGAAACVRRPIEPRNPDNVSPADDSAIVAVVQQAIADSAKVRLVVDSVRLPAALDEASNVTARTWRDRGDESIATGFNSLFQVGMRAAGDSVVRGCGSTFPTPVVWGCPTEREVVAVIGRPRPGGTLRIKNVGDSVETGKEYWSVRVLLTDLYPRPYGGSSLTTYDYVVVRRDRKWTFVRAVALLVLDR